MHGAHLGETGGTVALKSNPAGSLEPHQPPPLASTHGVYRQSFWQRRKCLSISVRCLFLLSRWGVWLAPLQLQFPLFPFRGNFQGAFEAALLDLFGGSGNSRAARSEVRKDTEATQPVPFFFSSQPVEHRASVFHSGQLHLGNNVWAERQTATSAPAKSF
ncbi:hypothetical protein NDU88_003409 [Pleurodeles waltl]|uniref:Uncharacterized protein n=1 Tax=Pleurodeles waltl TaxID=8319 RepID=A0AAV7VH96_PLEWA|nr:hypothetical protein NDU88_003409 [Pleurodeles waltl]